VSGIRNITLEEIKNDKEIKTYIEKADRSLEALGFTEHNVGHVTKCADRAAKLLAALGFTQREVERAWIAGYMHDIGNMVNRNDHAQTGAIIAFKLLDDRGLHPSDTAAIISAIGHHDDHTAFPVNAEAAALILADKTDVRRSRVRRKEDIEFDIHDRVNYSIAKSSLELDKEEKTVTLHLELDTDICPVMEYFQIFLQRMELCRAASNYFGLTFKLEINGQILL
jgi:metal-dependent HD superfamily phosphatase/phosphodiesterase